MSGLISWPTCTVVPNSFQHVEPWSWWHFTAGTVRAPQFLDVEVRTVRLFLVFYIKPDLTCQTWGHTLLGPAVLEQSLLLPSEGQVFGKQLTKQSCIILWCFTLTTNFFHFSWSEASRHIYFACQSLWLPQFFTMVGLFHRSSNVWPSCWQLKGHFIAIEIDWSRAASEKAPWLILSIVKFWHYNQLFMTN